MDIPFDDVAGVIPNREGRVIDVDGEHLPGVYATGWIKRGPVGLIGHTKSDASETIRHLGEDVAEGGEAFYTATDRDPSAVVEFLTGAASTSSSGRAGSSWTRTSAGSASRTAASASRSSRATTWSPSPWAVAPAGVARAA